MTITSHVQQYGYAGNVLRVDLTAEGISVEQTDAEILGKFMGGVGYAAKLLYDEIPVGIEPLSWENKVVFATGPLTGTIAPGSGSTSVCFKSPLTGIWGESRAGGEWGGALKRAGYDFLVIEGKAAEPKCIVIDDNKVEIRPAEKLKEKTTSEKRRVIEDELGSERFETVVIGPAGENLVRFANIMAGERAFGRAGAGAVMGSKNLLGIAVKGTGKIPVAHPDEFSLACKEAREKVLATAGVEDWSIHGTTKSLAACDAQGDIPTKNWRSNSWGKGEALYDHFRRHNLVTGGTCCKGCVLRCKRIVKVESGKWKTPQHGGGEYESMAAFTFFVFNEDVDAAVHADYLCNEYGLDSISTGAVIAFAMDCYENGIISREEADGLDLTWGNAETAIQLVKKISNRDGVGRILGEGVRRASQQIGRGSDMLAIHVKGLEGPAHDPRSGKALAIAYGLSNRGMCHIHPLETGDYEYLNNDFGLIPYGLPDPQTVDRFAEEGKGRIVKKLQDFGVLPDILGFCKFYVYTGLGPPELATMISTLTGWDVDGAELLRVGERVYNLQRMFNTREGIRKADDVLPQRCLRLPEFGQYASVKECEIRNLKGMLDECYQARGWSTETGVPLEGES